VKVTGLSPEIVKFVMSVRQGMQLTSIMLDKVTCLYGSVTGKAMSIAEHLVELGQAKGIEVGWHAIMSSAVLK